MLPSTLKIINNPRRFGVDEADDETRGSSHFMLDKTGTMTSSTAEESSFPIPASLQDLEREPYNLLPYPHNFDDDDEAARADSFGGLVDLIDQGNQVLLNEGILLFQAYEGQMPWLQTDRIQALYTLVRCVVSASC